VLYRHHCHQQSDTRTLDGMSTPPPFGFGPSGSHNSGDDSSGSGSSFNQLGQMLTQLGQMLSQAGNSTEPVNYDLAKQIALQRLTGSGDATVGFSTTEQSSQSSVNDAAHLAELWLDTGTTLPAGASTTVAWTPREWVEKTLPTWQRLCNPVAKQISDAWVSALPDEAKQAAGPMLSMLSQMGGMAFGSQLGNALGELASDVLTGTEVGLPLGPDATSALLPANIEKFTSGLDRPNSEVLVFLAAREAAHQRLFTHAPWLRQRLLDTVEEFARGITVDMSAIEQLASQIDPSNPASIEEAMSSSGLLQPQTTPQQQAALTRLETLLALVEGWVDVVVADAVADRLPGADALRETLRRRRATGGPAEQTFATLVGLELRPRRMRDAATLWSLVGEQHGVATRDDIWSHPDFLPTSEDLDDPTAFAQRLDERNELNFDPITELEKARQSSEQHGAEQDEATSPDPTTDQASNQDSDESDGNSGEHGRS